jgi:hypothetical protein
MATTVEGATPGHLTPPLLSPSTAQLLTGRYGPLLCCAPRLPRSVQSARAMSAFEQEPLFNPVTVGELVLNDLEHVHPSALLAQLRGVATCNFLSAMARTPPAVNDLAGCRQRIASAQGAVLSLSPAALRDLAEVELLCSRATSLLYCFPLCLPLIDRLLVEGKAQVKGQDEREAALSVFAVVDRDKGPTSSSSSSSYRAAASSARRLPKADRRSYTLFAPSAAQPSVGDRLYVHLFDDRDAAPSSYAAPSSAAASQTSSSTSTASSHPSSSRPLLQRRFRHPKGGGRFSARLHRPSDAEGEEEAALWSSAEMGEGEEDDEEPTLRMATAWQTHWPVE